MAEHRRCVPTPEQVAAERAGGGYTTRCICGHLWPCPAIPPHPETIIPVGLLPVVGGPIDGMLCPASFRGLFKKVAWGKPERLPYEIDYVEFKRELPRRSEFQSYWRYTG